MDNIPDCFYRVSVKALVLNETKDKFLVCKKESGVWELPGGGLDWGTTPEEDLPREIQEEMGLKVTRIAKNPSYFLTGQTIIRKQWVANIIYEAELEHLDFTPSDECVEIMFINKDNLPEGRVFPIVLKLAELFNPDKHK